MIRAFSEFVRREKLPLIFLGLFLGVHVWMTAQNFPSEPPSQEMQSFKKSEAAFQDKKITNEFLLQWFRESPTAAGGFILLTLLFAVLLVVGGVINIRLLFNHGFRRKMFGSIFPKTPHWKVSMLLHVMVQFQGIALTLHFLLGVILRFLNRPGLEHALILLQTLMMDFLIFFLIYRQIRGVGSGLSELGLRIPTGSTLKREILSGLGAYAAILPWFVVVLLALTALANFFSYEPPPHPLVEIFLDEEKRAPGLILFSIFLGCLSGPFFEEIFFRGFAYTVFRRKTGVWGATILSAAFFAIIHKNEFAFFPIFILGGLLAILYEKRGSLIAPIFIHVFHNSIFILYFWCAKGFISRTV